MTAERLASRACLQGSRPRASEDEGSAVTLAPAVPTICANNVRLWAPPRPVCPKKTMHIVYDSVWHTARGIAAWRILVPHRHVTGPTPAERRRV